MENLVEAIPEVPDSAWKFLYMQLQGELWYCETALHLLGKATMDEQQLEYILIEFNDLF